MSSAEDRAMEVVATAVRNAGDADGRSKMARLLTRYSAMVLAHTDGPDDAGCYLAALSGQCFHRRSGRGRAA